MAAEAAILWEWAGFALRWLHVVTAMAWIGASFYFIALDLGLRRAHDLPAGVHGEAWQVHGGGFYHVEKYLVAPGRLPEHLTWFKWESYATWLSGVALMAVIYWAGAELYLVGEDSPLSPLQAVAVSGGSLALGWLVYDRLCVSGLRARPGLLTGVLFGLLVAMGWGYAQVFTGRAMMLHLGAVAATIMTANVFLVIMPNQRVVVADLRAGRVPEARYGQIARLRSTHNNYLTLPVVFLMLSNHMPLAFATERGWLIAALVFAMGVSIRHFFNTMHAGGGRPWWSWGVTALIFLGIVWLSAAPMRQGDMAQAGDAAAQRFARADGFAEVTEIVQGRCAMCHARAPLYPGIAHAPRAVLLETPADIARQARAIYLQAGLSRAMPPANVTLMDPGERRRVAAWYRAAQR